MQIILAKYNFSSNLQPSFLGLLGFHSLFHFLRKHTNNVGKMIAIMYNIQCKHKV